MQLQQETQSTNDSRSRLTQCSPCLAIYVSDLMTVICRYKSQALTKTPSPKPVTKGTKGGHAKSAYNIFISRNFASKKESMPKKSTTEIMTELAKEWKTLPTQTKESFKPWERVTRSTMPSIFCSLVIESCASWVCLILSVHTCVLQ